MSDCSINSHFIKNSSYDKILNEKVLASNNIYIPLTPINEFLNIFPKMKSKKITSVHNELNIISSTFSFNQQHAHFLFQELVYNININDYQYLSSYISTNNNNTSTNKFIIECIFEFINQLKFLIDNFIPTFNKKKCSLILPQFNLDSLNELYNKLNQSSDSSDSLDSSDSSVSSDSSNSSISFI